jgi:hypothetical protein
MGVQWIRFIFPHLTVMFLNYPIQTRHTHTQHVTFKSSTHDTKSHGYNSDQKWLIRWNKLPAFLVAQIPTLQYHCKWYEGKISPIIGHAGPEVDYRYSSTFSLTSVLDNSGCLTLCPWEKRPCTHCAAGCRIIQSEYDCKKQYQNCN